MKILAIDYGTQNIGLALSDDSQKLAFTYSTLKPDTKYIAPCKEPEEASQKRVNKRLAFEIDEICKKEGVEKVIVGLPINLSGGATSTTQQVKDFIKELKNFLDISVETIDERLSTVQAEKIYPVKSTKGGFASQKFHRVKNKKNKNIDEISAQILLQSYLDKNDN